MAAQRSPRTYTHTHTHTSSINICINNQILLNYISQEALKHFHYVASKADGLTSSLASLIFLSCQKKQFDSRASPSQRDGADRDSGRA